jgi:hypothetical protein
METSGADVVTLGTKSLPYSYLCVLRLVISTVSVCFERDYSLYLRDSAGWVPASLRLCLRLCLRHLWARQPASAMRFPVRLFPLATRDVPLHFIGTWWPGKAVASRALLPGRMLSDSD